jgi:RimJ/RimL family protein N-acetyltransferase
VGIAPAPYRIETERLVIRCYEPRDAPLLKEAVDASYDHLREWMPWMRFEPQTLDEKVQLLRTFRGQFDLDTNYVYGVFSRDESRLVGGSGLHPRSEETAREIGYFVRADAVRRGFATEITAVLTRVGFELCGYDRIDIRIEPQNTASLGIPRKLGFVEEGVLRRRLDPYGEGEERRDAVMFTMLREELAASPALDYAYRAFDVLGRRVDLDQARSPEPGS